MFIKKLFLIIGKLYNWILVANFNLYQDSL